MERDIRILRYLAAMPFLNRLELTAVSDTADRTMHDVVADLKSRELVASVRHSTDLIASTRRLYVTSLGLYRLAEREGLVLSQLEYDEQADADLSPLP